MADLPYRIVPECPDDLRAMGLTVAVHNDYRLNGERHTFWLFTTADGRALKGEGKTDAEALDQVRSALASPSPVSLNEIVGVLKLFNLSDDYWRMLEMDKRPATSTVYSFPVSHWKAVRSLLQRLKAQTEDNKEGV